MQKQKFYLRTSGFAPHSNALTILNLAQLSTDFPAVCLEEFFDEENQHTNSQSTDINNDLDIDNSPSTSNRSRGSLSDFLRKPSTFNPNAGKGLALDMHMKVIKKEMMILTPQRAFSNRGNEEKMNLGTTITSLSNHLTWMKQS